MASTEPKIVFKRVYHCCGNDHARITILELPKDENLHYGLYDKENETYSADKFKQIMKDAVVRRGEHLAFFILNTSTGKRTRVLVPLHDWPGSTEPVSREFQVPVSLNLRGYLKKIS